MKRDFENFFTQCFHLGDCLWEDKTTGLTHQQVAPLSTRRRPCASARVWPIRASTEPGANRMPSRRGSPTSVSMAREPTTIDWSERLHGGTENALDLAGGAWLRGMVISRRVGLLSPI